MKHEPVKCKCGEEIPDEAILIDNKCNEEGEEYYEGDADCLKCGAYYIWSQWGNIEGDTSEAREDLQDHINKQL